MNTPTFCPLGTVKCHHMEESWYDKWESLRKSEKRAFREALRAGTKEKHTAWSRAQQRFLAHENSHSTQ